MAMVVASEPSQLPNRDMTYEEKAALAGAVNKLNSNNLGKVAAHQRHRHRDGRRLVTTTTTT